MKSMTGFGRGEVTAGGLRFSVELASVNRKQSDIVINVPRELPELEPLLRGMIAPRVSRGRVSVQVKIEQAKSATSALKVDATLAQAYVDGLKEVAKATGLPLSFSAADMLRAPGVFTMTGTAPVADDVWPHLEKAAQKACDTWDKARVAEGAELKKDLEARMRTLAEVAEGIRKLAPRVVDQHRTHLHKKLADTGLEIDLNDERLLKEIALFAERSDISEENARFESHLKQFGAALKSKEAAGRSMDFLCQELHRELNTTGAKASDAEISHLVVLGKTEVEKLREQVQNIE